MKYRCKSRTFPGGPCKHNCVVEVPFEPRGCLYCAVYEEWERVDTGIPITKCPKCGKPLCTCDDPDRLHCSDSKCGWTDIIPRIMTNLTNCPVCGAPINFDDDNMGTIHGFCSHDDCGFRAEVDYK
jgi:endogenous inhibitor of DNA gyrase (YacG/DUF329 family)